MISKDDWAATRTRTVRSKTMSTAEQTTEQNAEQAADPATGAWDESSPQPTISLELELAEAEALRAWLLKPAADGATSLDDQLVSRVLSRLGLEVDGARSAVNVRQELVQAGFSVSHLSDEQLRELGTRIADASSPRARG
jgi:hypothetical protein